MDYAIQENKVDDYDSILPLFIYEVEGLESQILEQSERMITKTEKVIALHNMEVPKRARKKMKRPEMNKWIDNNYLLLGQGHFYKKNLFKAEEYFLYVTRKYEDDNVVSQANNWLARIHMERGNYTKAINTLNVAGKGRNLENHVVAETNMVFADLYIQKGDYKNAVKKLQKAVSHIDKKKDRARPTFIFGPIESGIRKFF